MVANTAPKPVPLLSRPEAAAYLGVAIQTLAIWRTTGRYNLPVVKVGRRAMYRRDDLERFVRENTIGGSDRE